MDNKQKIQHIESARDSLEEIWGQSTDLTDIQEIELNNILLDLKKLKNLFSDGK